MTGQNVFPTPPVRQPITNADGTVDRLWLKWFTQVYAQVVNVALADVNYDYQVLTTGFNYVFDGNTSTVLIDGAGTLSSGTVMLPVSPVDGQIARIAAIVAVTTLTVSPAANQSIVGGSASPAAGTAKAYIFNGKVNTWYPYQ